nr:trypsin-like peptidase domain-containing protein [Planosporangium thailandense]
MVAGVGVARTFWRAAVPIVGTATTGGRPAGLAAPQPGTPVDPETVADLVTPGIVDVNTTLGLQGAQAAGTGIVLSSTGEVLTNNHVIAGATAISVTDIGNGQTYPATVVGYDRAEDIAVLRLSGASGLRTAPLGDSSKVAPGSGVVAIGNAGGVGGAPSVVSGTVTAIDQSITATDENGANAERLTGLIQVAADIRPGDSGGPLVDASGKVIGVDTAASTGFRFQAGGGTGFAIPINQAMTIAKQIQSGKASANVHIGATAILGVQVLSSQSGVQNGSGAPVAAVVSGSPADQAGLTRGDVIVSLDGQRVDAASTLTNLLDGHHPGDRVNLGWVDAFGAPHSATVRLATGPAA